MKIRTLFLGFFALLLSGACSSTSRSFKSDRDSSTGSPVGAPNGEDASTQTGGNRVDAGKVGTTPKPGADGGAPLMSLDASLPPIVVDASMTPMTDAAAPPPCAKDFDCDDRVDCTKDTCTAAGCTNTVDDGACTQAAGGKCDAKTGCQYPDCTPETCSAGSCQKASCVNDMCIRESLCGDGQSCCAGACVAAGCDDGVSCTADRCGAAGCEHAALDALCEDKNGCTTNVCDPRKGCEASNNSDPCADDVFCNGADRCAGGSCSTHQGNPCAGNSQCEEARDTCSGCASKNDCPDDVFGEWTTCDFGAEFCAETGTQTRAVTSFTCSAQGSCTPQRRDESRACTRKTSGLQCAETTFGTPTACAYNSACVNNGGRTRDRSDFVCGGGVCAEKKSVETESCSRDTLGNICGLCQTCDANQACAATPIDDDKCAIVDCPTDTECINYPADARTNRCASSGVCKTQAICAPGFRINGTECGDKCDVCDGKGNCSTKPADDAQCGVISCPASTTCRQYGGDITTNRCAALNQCIDATACMFTNAQARTDCGGDLQCSGGGSCTSPAVDCPTADCRSGSCCFDGKQAACGEKCDRVNALTCDEALDCNGGLRCCASSNTLNTFFGSDCAATCLPVLKTDVKQWLCKTFSDCPKGLACTGKLPWGQLYCEDNIIILPPRL